MNTAVRWPMEQGENAIMREGKGKKGSPYRYWQPSYEEPPD
jgi:hypothetical protein